MQPTRPQGPEAFVMPASPDETNEELLHLRRLLDSYTTNYRYTEEEISQFGPGLIPLHLLRQRDAFEAKRTELLGKIRDLETVGAGAAATGGPTAEAQLVLGVVPTGVLH